MRQQHADDMDADTDLGAKSGLLEYHAESVASWFRRYPTSTFQSAVYQKSKSKWHETAFSAMDRRSNR